MQMIIMNSFPILYHIISGTELANLLPQGDIPEGMHPPYQALTLYADGYNDSETSYNVPSIQLEPTDAAKDQEQTPDGPSLAANNLSPSGILDLLANNAKAYHLTANQLYFMKLWNYQKKKPQFIKGDRLAKRLNRMAQYILTNMRLTPAQNAILHPKGQPKPTQKAHRRNSAALKVASHYQNTRAAGHIKARHRNGRHAELKVMGDQTAPEPPQRSRRKTEELKLAA